MALNKETSLCHTTILVQIGSVPVLQATILKRGQGDKVGEGDREGGRCPGVCLRGMLEWGAGGRETRDPGKCALRKEWVLGHCVTDTQS